MTLIKPNVKLHVKFQVNCKDCKFSKQSQGELRCVLFQTRDNLLPVKDLRDLKGVCGPDAHYFKPK